MKIHPAAEMLPLLPEAELETLAQSIRAHGLKHPIVIHDGAVLDGRNRLLACKRAGVEPRFVEWTPAEGESPWDYVWATNAERRHLEAGTKAALGVKFELASEEWREERRRAEAEANRRRAEAARGNRHAAKQSRAPVPATVSPPNPRGEEEVRARTKLAQKIGVSPRTVQDAISLQKKAPDKFEQVARGEVSLKKAIAEVKQEEKRQLAEQIRKAPPPPPDGPYSVIAIDPPWQYGARAEDASHRGRNQYPDMTIEEICALPVQKLAADDCVLWLWTTNAFMREAYTCLDAWGFEAKTILTWDKQILGLGDYLRNVTEHCIVATRGRPLLTLTNQTTLISERRREHSRKPLAFYRLVDSLCPGSKLEMFAREPKEGWAIWGAETEKFRGVPNVS